MNLRHRWQAWRELWRRYREVFSHHWQQRASLTPPRLLPHESEFLPAALAVQTKPVSPTGRWVARTLMALVVILLLWSVFGRIDIVVSGQGRIIADGYTKTVAALEVASVRALHVSEGQRVKAGDVLIELDARIAESARDKADVDRLAAALQAARARAVLEALPEHRTPRLQLVEPVDLAQRRDAERHLEDQWRDYMAKRSRIEAEVESYAAALPLAQQQEEDYAQLASTRDVPQHAYLEKKQARLDLQRRLAEARHQLSSLTAETRKMANDALAEAKRIADSATQDVRRADVHGELLKILAPVDGTVQQLAVHTVGGVVSAAQPLMQIVPRQAQIEMEAVIENRDIGFVEAGQTAQVKIDTFDYTKYGTLAGKVSHVSRDAIQDEKRGSIYTVKLALARSAMTIDGRSAELSPGMSGTIEIKTGERRVIEYLLSPLVRHVSESLNER